jgi:energy-coupling factor transporter ATP-binding protein EcfA2
VQLAAARLYWGPAQKEEIAHRIKVEEVIDFLEIQDIRKTPVGRLPYGLQKRVELARALAAEPHILLLDEPMAGMNVEEKQDMCRFILDVNDQFGTTIVLIEHDMGVVMDISDRVVVLDYGKKIGDGVARRGEEQPRGHQAPISAPSLRRGETDNHAFLHRDPARRPAVGRHVRAGGLGFVLIYKASGVFNFAQGAMVFFAALAMARFQEVLPGWLGMLFGQQCGVLAGLPVAFIAMIVLASPSSVWCCAAGQSGATTLLMATMGITYVLEGIGQMTFGSQRTRIDVGMPKEPIDPG